MALEQKLDVKQGGQGEELKQTRAENELNKQINSIDHCVAPCFHPVRS